MIIAQVYDLGQEKFFVDNVEVTNLREFLSKNSLPYQDDDVEFDYYINDIKYTSNVYIENGIYFGIINTFINNHWYLDNCWKLNGDSLEWKTTTNENITDAYMSFKAAVLENLKENKYEF
jgi:hypothetical protein